MTRTSPPVSLDIIIPVFKTERFIRPLYERITSCVPAFASEYRIIFVDDGSPDASFETLTQLAREDKHVLAVRLVSNFGQHAAIAAGMSLSQGDWSAVMDGDLQDPPEHLAEMYANVSSGAQVVFAKRARRRANFRSLGSWLFFAMLTVSTGRNLILGYSNFTLLSRAVRERYNTRPERRVCYLPILLSLAVDHAGITYLRPDRSCGGSSYTFATIVRTAMRSLSLQNRVAHWLLLLIAAFELILAGALTVTGVSLYPSGLWLIPLAVLAVGAACLHLLIVAKQQALLKECRSLPPFQIAEIAGELYEPHEPYLASLPNLG